MKCNGKGGFYFDLHVAFTLICDLDVINDLYWHTDVQYIETNKIFFLTLRLTLSTKWVQKRTWFNKQSKPLFWFEFLQTGSFLEPAEASGFVIRVDEPHTVRFRIAAFCTPRYGVLQVWFYVVTQATETNFRCVRCYLFRVRCGRCFLFFLT